MYELIQLSEHDYYIDCPAKIGLVKTGENEAVLIDSGSDKDAGKKVFRILEDKGWVLKAIFNTHSHADHIGGNRFLQEKTGCKIYAKGMENVYSNSPILEPIGLYGGLPFKDLKHKFLLAQESTVLPLTDEVLPAGMKMLELPGHCFDMVGFLTDDGTAYIADCVSSEETLAKYGIGYNWDINAVLGTLEYVKTISAKIFVPAHAPVCENIEGLADINIESIEEVKQKIIDFCRSPITFEELLKNIFDSYSLMMSAQQYVLIGSTLRSYLSSLYDEGILAFEFSENKMLWKTL